MQTTKDPSSFPLQDELEKRLPEKEAEQKSSASYLLEVNNLNQYYGKLHILKNINFKLKPGAIYGLIGHNGAGKTTIIKSIVNGIIDYQGEIKINGVNAREAKSHKFLGYIPEGNFFIRGLNVFETIYYMALLKNIPKKDALKKAKELIDKFSLKDLQKRQTSKLSSGQKKKVLLAQALVNSPKLLILDEPAANLDPPSRISLFKLLRKILDDGTTVLISSHILDELEKYIDDVIIIKNGAIKVQEKLGRLQTNKLHQSDKKTITFEALDAPKALAFLKQHDNYQKVFKFNESTKEFVISFQTIEEYVTFLKDLFEAKIILSALKKQIKTLNEIYLEI